VIIFFVNIFLVFFKRSYYPYFSRLFRIPSLQFVSSINNPDNIVGLLPLLEGSTGCGGVDRGWAYVPLTTFDRDNVGIDGNPSSSQSPFLPVYPSPSSLSFSSFPYPSLFSLPKTSSRPARTPSTPVSPTTSVLSLPTPSFHLVYKDAYRVFSCLECFICFFIIIFTGTTPHSRRTFHLAVILFLEKLERKKLKEKA
jgi:hypothetical protein